MRFFQFIACLVCLALSLVASSSAIGYSPEHPEVIKMVDRGIAYLRTKSDQHPHHPTGTQILMAYTIFKVEHDANDPVVKTGVNEALKYIEKETSSRSVDHYFTYVGSLSMLLLLDVDAVAYEQPIRKMSQYLMRQQKPHGGFGYSNEKEGDNSQNQYAVLGMWSLRKAGFEIPPGVMEGVAMYLVRTQDPSGMWGYRGILPTGGGLVPQQRTQMSLTSAASGSLLIAGDFFNFYKGNAKRKKSTDDGLPDAVRPYEEEKEVREIKANRFNAELIRGSVGRALQFYAKYPFRFSSFPKSPHPYYYYALYAHERFMSFLENSQGEYENEPVWYNENVEDLKRLQDPDGGWGGENTKKAGHQIMLTPHENTAFAVLFLIRSTKRAIGELSSGVAVGGYSLPSDTDNIQVKGGQISSSQTKGGALEMMKLLEEGGGEEINERAIYDSLKLSDDPVKRADEIKRMKRLLKGGPYKLRRAAARVLGQSSDLDNVPTLIFALTDPDTDVRREARNALRFVSRKFNGFGMPDKPTPKELDDGVKAWKQWYLNANPSYVFLDEQ